MKKDGMISIRISDDEKKWIALIKRYDLEFNVSSLFRSSLAKKMDEIKEKVGANSVGFFEISSENKKVTEQTLASPQINEPENSK
jgi:hypothetical protein